ncbi:MAG: hypothetical protein CMJ86_07990 [Planctomycetes bacterium]|nr:hypothetical protein [Planctomycetota bacterium]
MGFGLGRWGASCTLGSSAFLAGASGMITQRLGLSALDLSLGAGLGAATGLSLYLASWALGAWRAGFWITGANTLLAGGAAGCSAGLLGWSVGRGVWWSLVCLCLAGFCQGLFLPLLARRRGAEGIPQLWALNLAGALVGVVLLGEWAAANYGVVGAALCAVLAALLAGALPSRLRPPRSGSGNAPQSTDPAQQQALLSPRAACAIVVSATLFTGLSESVLLRLAALDLGSMHAAMGHALGGALGALALGAWLLPRWLPKDGRGPLWCLLLAAVAHGVWFWPEFHLGTSQLYGWGAAASGGAAGLLAGVLLALPLLPLGAVVPTVHRAMGGESGRRLGDLLLPEALGALLVLPLLWFGTAFFGAEGLLALSAGLLCFLALMLGSRGLAASAATTALVLAWLPAPAMQTPALRRSEFHLLAQVQGPHFSVAVVDDQLRGERTLMTNDFRATATGPDYHYMHALGHLPALLHPAPMKVAVLAFGTGTTAGALAMHKEVQELHILELSRAVIEKAPHFAAVNRNVLRDPRVRLSIGDGRRSLKDLSGELDLLTMEPLLPDAPGAVYLYTEDFYAEAREALAPGGILCQWVPPHALRPETCRAVVGAFGRSFPWAAVFQYGSQWIMIGAEELPPLDSGRFPTEGPLAEALTGLGLQDRAGIAAHFWVLCPEFGADERALRDRDPWILHRPRPTGLEVLTWLPENMAWLRSKQALLPGAWAADLSARDRRGLEALSKVRLARELLSARRALKAGARLSGAVAQETVNGEGLELLLAEANELAPNNHEVLGLLREASFQENFSSGLGLLAAGQSTRALAPLLSAAEAKPRRSDAHLAFALAAEGQGSQGVALAAIRKALEQCPGLLESRAARKITALAPGETASLLRRVLDQAKSNP